MCIHLFVCRYMHTYTDTQTKRVEMYRIKRAEMNRKQTNANEQDPQFEKW